MNVSAREEILGSIRRHLSASRPFDAVRAEQAHHSAERATGTGSVAGVTGPSSLIERFKVSSELLGVHFHAVSDRIPPAQVVTSIIKGSGAKKIAISNSELIGEVVSLIETVEFERDPTAEFLFGADIGITSAQWGIAETGTLVLESEREDHRLISLIPPVHICIMEAGRIRETLGEVLEQTGADLSRTITFITGASRTSDIELTLAIGVHGPGELHIVIID